MEYRIRGAVPGDAAQLYQLNTLFNGPGSQSVEAMAATLSRGGELVLVAAGADRLLGFCCGQLKESFCYSEPAGEITELYVRRECRRNGIARALIGAMGDALRQQGAEAVTLLTGADNFRARALYESCGYRTSGEVHYEWTDPSHDGESSNPSQ
ncbi:GNAT family N-acetyltransferase [Ruminococcaceae bacterium OttesenSCG-928-L11]|nr:GNAT family N-acetyltransferase [Ruminococcaceae bacterium OttesenSCG-928-L11]